MFKRFFPLIVIILLAFLLRVFDLTEVPPGLTHDEANHGRDSMNILDGELLFYFPLNYGSEPLYNYVVAADMALLGQNLFALRMVNVWAGVGLIAAVFLWASWAFSRSVGLYSAALIAVSFWPVAASRQALRAGMLPLLATAAVIFFWLILRQSQVLNSAEDSKKVKVRWWVVAGFALALGLALHTYLSSRVLWTMFPIFLLYLAIFHRDRFANSWRPAIIGLAAAGLLVIPMFAYVRAHPEAETRLDMLDGPLQNLRDGDLGPILSNASEAVLSLFWPGFGDQFLAYNIPGRPLFTAVSAIFFVIGLGYCFWRWRKPGYAFLIIWFAVGIIPSLVTGPTANTTRNIGAMAPIYIIPAVGFISLRDITSVHWGRRAARLAGVFGLIWLIFVASITVRDYFTLWAADPDVRAAYQSNLVQSLRYLEEIDAAVPTVISSVYPGAAHDPSISRVLLNSEFNNLRFIDSRYGLISPAGQDATLIVPSSTPLHPAFLKWAAQRDDVFLRPDDLDPYFIVYDLNLGDLTNDVLANFDDSLTLREARWLDDATAPGGTAELLTVWEVVNPQKVGPRVPPAFETDAVLFTHVLTKEGEILTQQDRIEVPSWDWQVGDILVQIHPLHIPVETSRGQYKTVVGIYDRASGDRLRLLGEEGEISGTAAVVVPLKVK